MSTDRIRIFDPNRHVTFPLLGQYGRFGNMLFQIAATMAHAKRLGLEACFPYSSWRSPFRYLGLDPNHFLLSGVDMGAVIGAQVYSAPWNYEPIPSGARMLHGYYQSPWYWSELDGCPIKPPELPTNPIPLVAHVRRGDYEKVPDYHPVLTESYYSQVPQGRCRVVSADGGCSLWHDFLMLCSADVLILSNSSFALWAGYLGRAREVYYPVPWFGSALAEHNAEQMIPDSTKEKQWIPVHWK